MVEDTEQHARAKFLAQLANETTMPIQLSTHFRFLHDTLNYWTDWKKIKKSNPLISCLKCCTTFNDSNRSIKVTPRVLPGNPMKRIIKKLSRGNLKPIEKKLTMRMHEGNHLVITCLVCHQSRKVHVPVKFTENITLQHSKKKNKKKKKNKQTNNNDISIVNLSLTKKRKSSAVTNDEIVHLSPTKRMMSSAVTNDEIVHLSPTKRMKSSALTDDESVIVIEPDESYFRPNPLAIKKKRKKRKNNVSDVNFNSLTHTKQDDDDCVILNCSKIGILYDSRRSNNADQLTPKYDVTKSLLGSKKVKPTTADAFIPIATSSPANLTGIRGKKDRNRRERAVRYFQANALADKQNNKQKNRLSSLKQMIENEKPSTPSPNRLKDFLNIL